MTDSPAAHPPPSAPEPPAGSRRTTLLAWGVTALLVLGAVALIASKASQKPVAVPPAQRVLANVETLVLQAREYRDALVLPARITADQKAKVASELPGRLEKWLVREGEAVTQGQVIAVLADADLQAQLSQLHAARTVAAATVTLGERQVDSARINLDQTEKNAAALVIDRDSARADLELAEREFARVKALSATDVATQAEVERADNALAHGRLGLARAEDAITRAAIGVRAAQAGIGEVEASLALSRGRLAEVQAQIATLQVTVAKTEIRAAVSGQFESFLAEAGEVLQVGQELGWIYDLRFVRAEVDIPDRYVPLLATGSDAVTTYLAHAMGGARRDLRVMVRIPGLPRLTGGNHAGVEFAAVVDRVAQAADPASNTFRVELRFENPAGALREGILAQADIEFLVYPEALVVPLRAIQVTEAGPRLLVVEERDGRTVAAVRRIEPTSIREDLVLVGKGLTPGEHVIVAGGKGVLDGEEVHVLVADGQSQPRLTGSDSVLTAPPASSGR